ncbi:hypothetical protein [Desulfurococcus mucosus]|uniref:hypothetical protein n=1 Tax=Desulfurococcus mucosus TaxID=2275 RepID=UPI000B0802E5|nr:hypothetical protein [Desulfurococcus mucosus]
MRSSKSGREKLSKAKLALAYLLLGVEPAPGDDLDDVIRRGRELARRLKSS